MILNWKKIDTFLSTKFIKVSYNWTYTINRSKKFRDDVSNFVVSLLSNHLLKGPFIQLFFDAANVFDEHWDTVRSLWDEFFVQGFSFHAVSSTDRVVSRIVPRKKLDMLDEHLISFSK
jgi:hypothetical protein